MAPGNLEASKATPSVEITFEMLENSMATLQDWFTEQYANYNKTNAKEKASLKNTQEYIQRIGMASNLVPSITQDMLDGVKVQDSEFYPELWKLYGRLKMKFK